MKIESFGVWTTRAKNQSQDTSFKIKSAELDGNKRDPDEKIEWIDWVSMNWWEGQMNGQWFELKTESLSSKRSFKHKKSESIFEWKQGTSIFGQER